jgi:hypothetical protein
MADGDSSPRLLNGSETPVISENFKLSSLSSSPVGDHRNVNFSIIIFVFDLIGTLIGNDGMPIESALQFIKTLKQICEARRKMPVFFSYSEYLPSEEQLSKARLLERHLGFRFNSYSKLKRKIRQKQDYETIAEIYNNTFSTELENYPVFFFDDSLDQVKSMHSSAEAAYLSNPQMYFRGFYIPDNTSWDFPLKEILPIISHRAASVPSAPARLNLRPNATQSRQLELSPLLTTVQSPTLKRVGGKRSRKAKKAQIAKKAQMAKKAQKTRKIRKHLRA